MKKLYIFFEKLKKLNKVKNNILFARQVSTTKLSNPGPRPRELSWPVRQFIVDETIDWLVLMLGWNWKILLVIIESQKNLQKT